MGGLCGPDDPDSFSYEVMTANLKTGLLGQAKDIIHGAIDPTAASSLHRIALCGGMSIDGCSDYCQVYSPKNDRCACHRIRYNFYTIKTIARLPFFLRAALKFGRRVHFALRRKMLNPPIAHLPAI